jgi:hypothetical protein
VTLEHRIAFTVRSDLTTRSLNASLKGFGSPPTPAEIVVETLTVSQRLRRAAVALGLAAALALVALPIPLVHFVLVPAALLLGLIFAALRLNQREIIRSAEGSCPYCSTHQRLGLAGRVFRLPVPPPRTTTETTSYLIAASGGPFQVASLREWTF